MAVLAASIVLSLLVVLPQLGRLRAGREWRSNMIYFGHLRHWDPAELATALEGPTHSTDQLARQLVTMSKIAWRKHSWLQYSLLLLVASSLLLVVAGA